MKFTSFLAFSILAITLASCNGVDPIEPLGAYEHGFFIANEGPFGSGSGSLTYVSDDYTYTEQQVFFNVNNEALGNIVQSLYVHDHEAYIVVNNSNRLVLANRYTMEQITQNSTDLENPRYACIANNKLFVSNWGDASDATDDFVAVLNENTLELITKIPVGEGPEKIVVANGAIYVALKGGWSFNDKVVRINPATYHVEATITVGDVPHSLVEKNGDVYVLCTGLPSWSGSESEGGMYKIGANNQSQEVLDFINTEHPSALSYDGGKFYYFLNGQVYEWNGTASSATALSNISGYFYNVVVAEGKVYCLDAGDYSSAGSLKIYNVQNSSVMTTVTTGVVPNDVVFN